MFDDEAFKALKPADPEPASQETVDKAREILGMNADARVALWITGSSRDISWHALVFRAATPPYGWIVYFTGISVLFRGQEIPPQTTEEQWVRLLQLFIDTGDFRPFIDVDLPDFLN